MTIRIEIIPLLKDNYSYLVIDPEKNCIVIDPAQAAPVQSRIEKEDLTLKYILNTHHHGDHTAGNLDLKKMNDCEIVAPFAETARIENVDIAVREGDYFSFSDITARIIETPGHTSGHICFYFEALSALFCGDTLFSMGCGRLFEGTADEMWRSLEKIMKLPDDTKIYCGHEYTLSNGTFCLSVEPENQAIIERIEDVTALTERGKPSIPSTLEMEKQTNVFLRAGSATRFAELRALKDFG
jgi:hydroxyacylglutathione hydrolase